MAFQIHSNSLKMLEVKTQTVFVQATADEMTDKAVISNFESDTNDWTLVKEAKDVIILTKDELTKLMKAQVEECRIHVDRHSRDMGQSSYQLNEWIQSTPLVCDILPKQHLVGKYEVQVYPHSIGDVLRCDDHISTLEQIFKNETHPFLMNSGERYSNCAYKVSPDYKTFGEQLEAWDDAGFPYDNKDLLALALRCHTPTDAIHFVGER